MKLTLHAHENISLPACLIFVVKSKTENQHNHVQVKKARRLYKRQLS